jgi:hypothetical protein
VEKLATLFMVIMCAAIVALVVIGTVAVFKVGGILLGLYVLASVCIVAGFVFVFTQDICIG